MLLKYALGKGCHLKRQYTFYTDFTIFQMAEVKPFVKPFILGVIDLSMMRQDWFYWQSKII